MTFGSFDWGQTKAMGRRAVHATFAIPVSYVPKGTTTPLETALGTPLTARLHNRVQVQADALSGGYAQIIEGITKCVFNVEELAAQGIIPAKGDKVTFVEYGITVILDTRDTPNGPINDIWNVSIK